MIQYNILACVIAAVVLYFVIKSCESTKSTENFKDDNVTAIDYKAKLDNTINKSTFDVKPEIIYTAHNFSALFGHPDNLYKSIDAKKPGPFKVISNNQYYLDKEHCTQYLPIWKNVTKTIHCRDDTKHVGTKCLLH